MAWRRLRSLRTRLLWLVLLTLAPVLALHVASAMEKQAMARQAVERGMHSIADLAAGSVHSLLSNAGDVLHGLTHLAVVQSFEPDAITTLFTEARDIFPSFSQLVLLRPDGELLAAAQPHRGSADQADRPWLQQALATPDQTIDSYQTGTEAGQSDMVLAHSVGAGSGPPGGVCAVVLRPDWFAAIFSGIRMPEAAKASLFDASGTVLATWPTDPAAVGRPLPGVEALLPRLAAEAHAIDWIGPGQDGLLHHAIFSPVGPPDRARLFIRLSQPETIHAAILATTWQRDMLFFGLAVALALAAAHLFNQTFILRPAKQLAAMAKAMAAGDLDRRSGLADGRGEIADLGQALDTMADRLRQRIRFTQELIDAIPAPLFYKGLDGRYIGCNAAYDRDIRRLDAIVNRTVHTVEPGARAALCTDMDQAALRSSRHSVEYETSLEYSDGSVRNVVVFKSVFRESTGVPAGIIGVLLDITARKRSETELLASQSRYHLLLDSMHDGFVVVSGDFRLVESNPAFRDMLGYNAAELSTMTYRDITPEAWHPIEEKILTEVDAGSFSGIFEKEYRHKDGHIFPVALRLHRHPAGPGDDHRYFAVVRDTTEVKAIESALRLAKEAAETANRAKSDFLAKMSHEIRTPLHAVIGMTELTLGTELSPQQRDALQTVREAAGNLLAIINDILDLSRIEAKKLELIAEDYDLRRTLVGVARTLRPQARRKGLALTLTVAPDVPRHIRGDQGRLRQILLNLVGNAVKFTEHGHVTLAVAVTGNPARLELAVADTGVGIPPDRLDSVFALFTQADSSVARRFGGTGLGLAICRELSRLMGGIIEARSTLGQGSLFRVLLPLTPALTSPPPPQAPAPREPLSREDSPAPSPLRVLVAEDNPVNVKVATTYLARRGHQATVAVNGRRALEQLGREIFDVVLMDVEMPELDGMEATRRLRAGKAGPANRDVPVVAMTAHALSGFMERCLDAGMTDFLTKPLDFASLDALLGHIAAGRHAAPDASAAADGPGAVLDTETALGRLGDDDALLREIESDFLRQYPRKLRLISLCSNQENWDEATLAAHSLKNIAGAVGAESSRRLAGRLEACLRENDAVAAHEILAALKQELAAVAALLKTRPTTLPTT
jgi:PAS domain S-box-containing protein